MLRTHGVTNSFVVLPGTLRFKFHNFLTQTYAEDIRGERNFFLEENKFPHI
jgi:hypothetical protein